MIQELKKQDNSQGYINIAEDVLSVIRKHTNNVPFMDSYLFWKKTLYSHEGKIRYAFLNFINVYEKQLLLFQFSFDKEEVLKYVASYHIQIGDETSLLNGWCYLVRDNVPFGITKAEIEYIDGYLKEIKPELLEVMS